MRLALMGASLVLVGGLAAGCGGDSSDDSAKADAGDDKNVKAFCDANREAGTATDLKALQGAVGNIEDKLLDDISGDAEDGFDVLRTTVEKAESEKDLQKFQKDLSKKELDQIQAYNDYGQKLCTPDASSSPSESPSAE